MNADEKTLIICMSCMTPNDGSDKSCRNCGSSLSGTSSLDPVQTIQNEGALLRKAVYSRPKLIVLFGTWLLFVPWIIGTIFIEIEILSSWDGVPSLLFFLGGIALFLMAAIIIFKVTRNYFIDRGTFDAEHKNNQIKAAERSLAKSRRQARMKNKAV